MERRRARRFDVEWGVVVRGKDQTGSGFIEEGSLMNLSSRGAFLSLSNAFKTGARLDISIRLPDDNNGWMSYSAEVVRIQNSSPKTGIAVKFSPVRPRFVKDEPN